MGIPMPGMLIFFRIPNQQLRGKMGGRGGDQRAQGHYKGQTNFWVESSPFNTRQPANCHGDSSRLLTAVYWALYWVTPCAWTGLKRIPWTRLEWRRLLAMPPRRRPTAAARATRRTSYGRYLAARYTPPMAGNQFARDTGRRCTGFLF